MNETLQGLQGSTKITRLDMRMYYNQIGIKEGDEWKTAFRTQYGLFEYLVMPFGLTNAPATAQRFNNDVLREYLNIFLFYYLDDILVYTTDGKNHEEHVCKVLRKMQEVNLFLNPEKCEFSVTSTTFLGFVVAKESLSMDLAKVEAVEQWETPGSVYDFQYFLGFAKFYQGFIKDYGKRFRPFYYFLQNDVKWNWSKQGEIAFKVLQNNFCTAPVLRHYNPSFETTLETDASETVIASILSQKSQESGKLMLHLVAYFLKKMTPAECNYG
jgi:hypothetical protein